MLEFSLNLLETNYGCGSVREYVICINCITLKSYLRDTSKAMDMKCKFLNYLDNVLFPSIVCNCV